MEVVGAVSSSATYGTDYFEISRGALDIFAGNDDLAGFGVIGDLDVAGLGNNEVNVHVGSVIAVPDSLGSVIVGSLDYLELIHSLGLVSSKVLEGVLIQTVVIEVHLSLCVVNSSGSVPSGGNESSITDDVEEAFLCGLGNCSGLGSSSGLFNGSRGLYFATLNVIDGGLHGALAGHLVVVILIEAAGKSLRLIPIRVAGGSTGILEGDGLNFAFNGGLTGAYYIEYKLVNGNGIAVYCKGDTFHLGEVDLDLANLVAFDVGLVVSYNAGAPVKSERRQGGFTLLILVVGFLKAQNLGIVLNNNLRVNKGSLVRVQVVSNGSLLGDLRTLEGSRGRGQDVGNSVDGESVVA